VQEKSGGILAQHKHCRRLVGLVKSDSPTATTSGEHHAGNQIVLGEKAEEWEKDC